MPFSEVVDERWSRPPEEYDLHKTDVYRIVPFFNSTYFKKGPYAALQGLTSSFCHLETHRFEDP